MSVWDALGARFGRPARGAAPSGSTSRATPSANAFPVTWVCAVVASVAALSVFLSVRVCTLQMAYDLGRADRELSRLREVERALRLEVAAYESPERVEVLAHALLGMRPPQSGRSLSAGPSSLGAAPTLAPSPSPQPTAGERVAGLAP